MLRVTTIVLTTALFACGGGKPATKPTPPETPAPPETRPAPDEPKPMPPPPPPDPEQIKADLLAAETTAYDSARPVFEKYCSTCHTDSGKKAAKKKLDHFNMTSYPFGGHHTATMGFTIREVLGQSGKKATMPYGKAGTVKGDELALIIAWTDAWEAADKGGAHPPAPPAGKDDD